MDEKVKRVMQQPPAAYTIAGELRARRRIVRGPKCLIIRMDWLHRSAPDGVAEYDNNCWFFSSSFVPDELDMEC